MRAFITAVFLTYICSILCTIEPLHAAVPQDVNNENPVLVFSTTKAPFYFLDEYGEPAGIHIDIWKMIFAELNVNYTFTVYESGSERIKEYVRKGTSFMHFNLSKKKDRMRWGLYPEEEYLYKTICFFIRAEDQGEIFYNGINDLKGLKVGASKTYTYTKEFWGAGLDLDIIPMNHLQMAKLLHKRIDVVPLALINTLYQLKKEGKLDEIYILPKPLTIRPYYNVFSKAYTHPDKQKILDNYDRIIKRMKQDGTIKKVYEKYIGEVNFEWLDYK